MEFTFQLLQNLFSEGHKVLVFSRTKLLLNMVEGVMKQKGYGYARLDGDVPIPKRDAICKKFEQDP